MKGFLLLVFRSLCASRILAALNISVSIHSSQSTILSSFRDDNLTVFHLPLSLFLSLPLSLIQALALKVQCAVIDVVLVKRERRLLKLTLIF